jgi:hypothetical protein
MIPTRTLSIYHTFTFSNWRRNSRAAPGATGFSIRPCRDGLSRKPGCLRLISYLPSQFKTPEIDIQVPRCQSAKDSLRLSRGRHWVHGSSLASLQAEQAMKAIMPWTLIRESGALNRRALASAVAEFRSIGDDFHHQHGRYGHTCCEELEFFECKIGTT